MPFYILAGATLMTALTVPRRLSVAHHRTVVYLVAATVLTVLALWLMAPESLAAWSSQPQH
jgi:hypothetical protein